MVSMQHAAIIAAFRHVGS